MKENTLSTYLEKLQFNQHSKNFIAEILSKSLEKYQKKSWGGILGALQTEKAKNLLYVEIYGESDQKMLPKIFSSYRYISEVSEFDLQVIEIIHILSKIPLINIGKNFIIIKGKNKGALVEIKKKKNDFSYISYVEKYTTYFDNKKSIKKINNEKSMLEKRRNDCLALPNFSDKTKFHKKETPPCIRIIKDYEIRNQNKDLFSSNILSRKIGVLFYSKQEESFKILIEVRSSNATFLELDGSTKFVAFENANETLVELDYQKTQGIDCFGNIIFSGDKVFIVSGKHKKNYGVVKYIKNSSVFLCCPFFFKNNGFVALSLMEIMVFTKKGHEIPSIKKNFFHENNIRKGIIKRQENKIVKAIPERMEVELLPTGKSINIYRENCLLKKFY